MENTDWQGSFQAKLSTVALEEAAAQRRAHIKKGRIKKTFRYAPPQWHIDAMSALGRNDEEAAKAALMYR